MASIDDQIPRIRQTEKHEIEEGSKVDHFIDIPDTIGQDPSGSQRNKSINEISSIKSCTIFKVNVWLRESNPDAYTPKIVSIGPYHKKNPRLHPMKKYKLLCRQQFLGRKEGLDVESCISELEKLKEEAINCYEDVKDAKQFCQMLLLDGCFVVEFFREYCRMWPEVEDKIFSDNNLGYILRDLMLLENQLPFFILNKLYDMTKRDYESSLAALLVSTVNFLPFFDKSQEGYFRDTRRFPNVKHILHLVHITYTSCHGNRKIVLENNDVRKSMPNAIDLSGAGVSFKKVDVTTTPFDSIEFEKGVMKIPCFKVVDFAEIYLRNLIAYEQQSDDVHLKYFGDFAIFMDHLIDSDKDVNLLQQKGIILNRIGEDKEVTNFFNKIGKGVMSSDFYYKEEFTKASQHCEYWWNRMMGSLKRNYFSNPSGTMGAIVILILTTTQTVLAFTGSVK